MPPLPTPNDDIINVFRAHGINPNPSTNGQASTDCPFCGREEKFYINRVSGLFDCKVCGVKGNPIEFLRLLYQVSLDGTTEEQYQELARERKYLGTNELKELGFAFNPNRDEWIVPGFFQENSRGGNKFQIKQLYHWTDYKSKDGKKHLQATPTFSHCLYGVREFDDSKPDIWCCEGPWDYLALKEILSITKLNDSFEYEQTGNIESSLYSNINLLAIPSTTVLNEQWLYLLSGKRVFLLLDNDHPKNITDINGKVTRHEPPAWSAYQRIVRKIIDTGVRPQEIKFLYWGKDRKEVNHNPSLKAGYDVRDLLSEGYTKSIFDCTKVEEKIEILERRIKNLSALYDYLQPVLPKWIDPTAKDTDKPASKNKKELSLKLIECEDWNQLIKSWQDAIVWFDGLEKTLAAMLSCIMSTMIPGTQLWMRVIAPPSCGKSVLCDALCTNRNFVTMQSNIRGFFSGMRPTKKSISEGRTDLGLIMEIMNKTFVTKDGDTILQAPDRPRIMAEARDLYDGSTKTHFRTGMGQEYPNIRTTWILCGTPPIKEIGENELGERFIDCEIIRQMTPELEEQIALRAIKNMRNLMKKKANPEDIESFDDESRLIAKKMTGGYIQYLCTKGQNKFNDLMNKDNPKVDLFIHHLGKFVSYMRARPGKKDEYVKRELSARVSEQLFRLASCMSIVMNQEEINTKVLRRVSEVAYDTAQGSVFTMTYYLYTNPKGATYGRLANLLQRKETDLQDILRYLRRLNAFSFSGDGLQAMNGYGDGMYTLSPELRSICDKVFPYMEHIL